MRTHNELQTTKQKPRRNPAELRDTKRTLQITSRKLTESPHEVSKAHGRKREQVKRMVARGNKLNADTTAVSALEVGPTPMR